MHHLTRRMWLLGPLALVLLCLGGIGTAPAGEFDIPPDIDKFDDDDKDSDPKKKEPKDPFADERSGLDPDTVNAAIEKGVRWLKARQQRNGSWGETRGSGLYGGGDAGQGANTYGHPAGPTALSLLALLKCDVPVGDPYVQRGFKYLRDRHKQPGGSYETSVLLMALIATGDPHKSTKGRVRVPTTYRGWARDLLHNLIERRRLLGWRYQTSAGNATPGGEQDMNSTQWAALALLEAYRAGFRVPRQVCEDVIKFTLSQQDEMGPAVDYPLGGGKTRPCFERGFSYIKGQEHPDEGSPTGAVTAGGIANLQIMRYILTDGMSEKGLRKWNKRADAHVVQRAIYDGLAWMHVNWHPEKNPKKRTLNIYHVYWLYATERAMDLLGLKLIGQRPWYMQMGSPLVQKQFPDGRWESGSTHKPGDVLDTGFALLFLCRATQDAIPNPQVTPGEDNPKDVR